MSRTPNPQIPDGIRRALRLPTTRERLLRELDDEIRFHVEMRVARLTAAGMSADDAYAEALRRFGDVDDLRDYCNSIEVTQMRRAEKREWVGSIMQDVRFALRQLRKSPGFSFVAAVTLALGVGATTAIFTVVSAVVLKPLAFAQPDRIVQLWEVTSYANAVGPASFTDPTFDDLQRQNSSFAAMAQYSDGAATLMAGGEAMRARTETVSHDYFDVFGVKPMLGRAFAPEEQQLNASPVAIISYGFWQRQFGGSAAAIGATLVGDAQTIRVVGVLPPDLEYPAGADLFMPREQLEKNPSRTAHNWQAVARLKPGVTLEQAQSDMSSILRRIKADVGGFTWTIDGQIVPLREQLVGKIKPMLFLLLAASGVLLLIACANVVNLLVARMAARDSEIALRLALGAGRGRLVQQLVTESSILAALGCAGGLTLAFGGVKALLALRPPSIPRLEALSVDWRVLAFALLVSAGTAIALGLLAAWRASRGDLRAALAGAQRTQAGGGASYRIRSALVVVQLAMTVVLLVGAGLLARSFVHLLTIDPGFRTRDVVVASMNVPGGHDPIAFARRTAFLDEAVARASAFPGVTSAGGASTVPLGNFGGGDGTFLVMASAAERIDPSQFERVFQDKTRTGYANYRLAGPGYFKTMGIPIVAGRAFGDGDQKGAPEVAVISASLAKKRWPNEDPIGKAIEFGNMDGDLTPMTIVGIVGDVRDRALGSEPNPTIYGDYRQRPGNGSNFVIAMATTTPATTIASTRQALRQMRADIPVRLTTMETLVSGSVSPQRFMLVLIGVFGSVALLLATLGIYSVISFLVAQRGREISIRIALGATAGNVLRLVLGQGLRLAAVGLVIGGIAAVLVTRVLRQMLYQISTTDPAAFGAVVGLLCVVAVVASYVPARRAAKAEPMDVLRGA